MAKKIELKKIPCGEAFKAFGEVFTVLDHVDGGVLAIRKDYWKNAPFDTGSKNNLSEASIRNVLGEYVVMLKNNGAKDDDLLPLHIDLKATDGTRAYGYFDTNAGLLTLEQYGRYKDIIPFASGWWWLATPWATRWLRSPYTYSSTYAWYVNTDGNYSSYSCSISNGVRPVLNFSSSLLVSPEDTENGEDSEKKKAYKVYCAYLAEWAEEHSDGSDCDEFPLSFDDWMEDEYEPEDDEDEE